MHLKTSFAFYFVSLTLYLVVLTTMALADKRVKGTRWLAYSVMVEMVKVALQGMAGSIPRTLSVMVANDLNIMAFFTMYLGLRWFVHREPLQSRIGPALILSGIALYSGMFLLHLPYGFHLIAAMVIALCGLTVQKMWKQCEVRFVIPARITLALLLMQIGLVLYRVVLATAIYRSGLFVLPPVSDVRWDYSMMFILMLSNCLLILYVWFAAAEMYSAVEMSAGTDALTGCLNRRALMKVAEHEMLRSQRTDMPLTVVAIDLDHFKDVNDTYGHSGGDAVLCAVVTLLKNRLRSVDVIARTGGEEFLLLLPDTDAISGAKVIEGLRQAIQAMRVPYESQWITTTVSFGVTQSLPRQDSWTAMTNRADRALYAAKDAGRNLVMLDEIVAGLPRRAIGVREDAGMLLARAAGSVEGAALRLIRRREG